MNNLTFAKTAIEQKKNQEQTPTQEESTATVSTNTTISSMNYWQKRNYLLQEFTKQIRSQRRKFYYSNRDIARKANISATTVWRVHHGYTQNILAYIAVADVLGMNLSLTQNTTTNN